MPEDFSELQTLLRLKRHEMPPPGYLEDFLGEFHRRQRVELLRRPLWRIALDRLSNLVPTFPNFPVPNLAYAGVSAVALLAAAVLVTRPAAPFQAVSRESLASLPVVAVATTSAAALPQAYSSSSANSPMAAVSIAPDLEETFFGANPGPVLVLPPARSATVSSDRPRYLLDTRPARYEPRSTSF